MSKPRYRWWGYVRNVIRAYPELRRQYEDLHSISITASYGGMEGGRGSGVSDPTMRAAILQLPKQEQREFEAVNAAVWVTSRYPNGKQRMEIIRLVYWKRSHTVDGAGEVVGYKEAQARRIHNAFVVLVAEYLGVMER